MYVYLAHVSTFTTHGWLASLGPLVSSPQQESPKDDLKLNRSRMYLGTSWSLSFVPQAMLLFLLLLISHLLSLSLLLSISPYDLQYREMEPQNRNHSNSHPIPFPSLALLTSLLSVSTCAHDCPFVKSHMNMTLAAVYGITRFNCTTVYCTPIICSLEIIYGHVCGHTCVSSFTTISMFCIYTRSSHLSL